MRLTALFCVIPFLATAQVPQGAPNADFQPAFAGQTRAAALPATDVDVTRVARGLDRPWGIARLSATQYLVTERAGNLRIVGSDGSISAALPGVPDVRFDGQGGLLDVAVSPRFAQDRTIFLTYAKPVRGGAVTAAARATLGPDGALSDVRDIFVQSDPSGNGRHFGSRVVPMADGTVWITTGDRGAGDRGTLVQDPTSTHGKLIRVMADGSIPSGNPFVGRAGDDAIWSSGHRNVQGADIGPDGAIWTMEHGPRGGDELNRPVAGGNYGWPIVSYGINYRGSPVGSGAARANPYLEPIYYWDPVIAPSGMRFYQGDHGPWQGDLFVGSLNPGALVRIKLQGGRVVGEERLLTDAGRVRDVELSGDGALLVITDAGELLRVDPR